ncbi:lymphocyte antigen 6G-like [Xiphias gladius]|uniref:lymphocyte antigen 6G-like n=1 Tax=Xiphias gladius TaxID=8245 RepID=UPI001A97DB69|nr:lymphocyte antigen 6G-like [Xiphias gladius]
MMRLYGALILFMILSTACGLKCYSCVKADPTTCTRISTCPEPLDRCFSLNVTGYIAKGCRKSINCVRPVSCCEEDLCNSAIPTGPSVVLLLVSSAIITLFL